VFRTYQYESVIIVLSCPECVSSIFPKLPKRCHYCVRIINYSVYLRKKTVFAVPFEVSDGLESMPKKSEMVSDETRVRTSCSQLPRQSEQSVLLLRSTPPSTISLNIFCRAARTGDTPNAASTPAIDLEDAHHNGLYICSDSTFPDTACRCA
jgi:hypothetical protein